MKIIVVKRIDLLSLIKPLFLIAGIIGTVIGIVMSLFLIPTSLVNTHSSNGVVITSVTSTLPEAIGNMGTVIILSIANCLGIALAILVGIVLFNFICKLINGIKIEIEDEE